MNKEKALGRGQGGWHAEGYTQVRGTLLAERKMFLPDFRMLVGCFPRRLSTSAVIERSANLHPLLIPVYPLQDEAGHLAIPVQTASLSAVILYVDE